MTPPPLGNQTLNVPARSQLRQRVPSAQPEMLLILNINYNFQNVRYWKGFKRLYSSLQLNKSQVTEMDS